MFFSPINGAVLILSTVEFSVISLDEVTGAPHVHIYKPEEVDALLKEQGLTKVSGDMQTLPMRSISMVA